MIYKWFSHRTSQLVLAVFVVWLTGVEQFLQLETIGPLVQDTTVLSPNLK